ncbi:MAG: efflux RND transporter periplasmic adaptor subunit [Cyanobacteriota bacterium]
MSQTIATGSQTSTQNQVGWRAIPLLALMVVGGGGLYLWRSRIPPETGSLWVSGRLEGYETDIGARLGGRIAAVMVREGDPVAAGQMVVQIEDAEVQAQLMGAEARMDAAQDQVNQAQQQLAIVQSQMREVQISLQQSQADAQGRISQADAGVAAAQAQLSQAQAQVQQTEADLKLAIATRDRFAPLVQEGVISRQLFDQYEAQVEVAQAVLESRLAALVSAQEQVRSAQGSLGQAQATDLTPRLRQAQLDTLQHQLTQAQYRLNAAQAERRSAEASRDQVQAQLDYLHVLSPINGVVIARTVEPGQVVGSGRTLLTVVDLEQIYLRGFVPGDAVGRIRVGQTAQVYLDSDPRRENPLLGQITQIDVQAAFTPENIYFREDRVKQVFGIRITLEDPDGWAKPGMPADAEIPLRPTP